MGTTLGVIALAALVVMSNAARADTFLVSIDTTALAGAPATLAFDFIDGGPPSNDVTLGTLTTDGTLASADIDGDVSGAGPWTFADTTFFSELRLTYDPLGASLSFSFTVSGRAPDPGAFPDAFSFFILDAVTLAPLVTTDDPTGANALFLYSFEGSLGPTVYTPDTSGVSIRVEPVAAVPEPATIAMIALGVLLALARRRSPVKVGDSAPSVRRTRHAPQGAGDGGAALTTLKS